MQNKTHRKTYCMQRPEFWDCSAGVAPLGIGVAVDSSETFYPIRHEE